MKQFYYLTEKEEVIRVPAKRRPSETTAPRPSRTWMVQEFTDATDCFGWHATWQITWGRLKQLTFIGGVKP